MDRLGGPGDRGLLLEKAIDPPHRRGAALDEIDRPAERDHRPHQHTEIDPERDELADRHGATHHQASAREQHGKRAQAAEQREKRKEEALHPGQAQVLSEVVLAQPAKPRDLRRLLPVGADHPDARKVFMGLAGEVAELRLNRFGPPMDPLSDHDHRDGEAQERQQSEACQPGADSEHRGCN